MTLWFMFALCVRFCSLLYIRDSGPFHGAGDRILHLVRQKLSWFNSFLRLI